MLERWRRRLKTSAVLIFALFATCRLGAQELGPTLLSYRAADGCPNVAAFQRSVQGRSARVRFVEQGAHDRELSIDMRKDGDFTNGELRLVERDGSLRQRNVRFTTCSEAVEGLALIAVVSLDPQALLQQPDTPPQPAPAALPEPAAKAPPSPKAPAKSELVVKPQHSKTRWALGGELNVAFRALPATALGGSLFVDVASGSESLFAPLFRAAASHVERRGLSSSDGAEANFTLTLLTLSACPLRLAAGFLGLRPCAFVSGGALHAWGSEAQDLQQTRPYGALGGSVLLFARVSQTVDLVADLALAGTLVRDSFGFGEAQAWQTPALYLSSGIGVRFVFP